MKHVLVIRLSALGDAAILVPVVQAYASANPDILFTIAAPALIEPLFEGLSNVQFLGVKKQQSVWKLAKIFDQVGADSVADMHYVNRVIAALWIYRCRRWLRLKFHTHIKHLQKNHEQRRKIIEHTTNAPCREQWQCYADVFDSLGLKKGIFSAPTPKKNAEIKTVGVAPFAQHTGKIWGIENTATLVAALVNRGCTVCLFGDKKEIPELKMIADDNEHVKIIAGQYTFSEEMTLIKDLDVMVSMDSANMHFASALGTRVVSLWGATHPALGFYGYKQDPNDAVCLNLDCQPCSAYGKAECKHGDYRCLNRITTEMVINKIFAH